MTNISSIQWKFYLAADEWDRLLAAHNTHDHDGLLMPPRSVAGLSGALECLIANPDLCRQLGRNARITAEGYSWDLNVRRMLELLGIDSGGPR